MLMDQGMIHARDKIQLPKLLINFLMVNIDV